MLTTDAYFIPYRLRVGDDRDRRNKQTSLGIARGGEVANLSSAARAYLAKLGIENPDADTETAGLIWMHALAIGYSPAYLTENADGIRQDWPRIPLPDSKQLLLASAELGKQIAALLDTETPYDAAVAALSSAPNNAGGDTGATGVVDTIFCNHH